MDRGVVNDKDDDDADEEAGMNISLSNAGMFHSCTQTSHPTPTLVQVVAPLMFCLFAEKKKRKWSKKKKTTKNRTFPAMELKKTTPPRLLISTLFPSEYPTENSSRTRIRPALPTKNHVTIRVSGTKAFSPVIARLQRSIVRSANMRKKSSSSQEQVFYQLLRASKMEFACCLAIRDLKPEIV